MPTVAIIDYGLGNLFSIQQACAYVGLAGRITSDAAELHAADAVLLPGVGAFGDAMAELHRSGLANAIRDLADAGKPLVGVCLGMQLLMSESEEFGPIRGLDIIPGRVVYLREQPEQEQLGAAVRLKVPQVGWNRVLAPEGSPGERWAGTPLAEVAEGTFMYFVHSLYVVPEDLNVVLSVTPYGDVTFCSALRWGNVFATQYHPERSGAAGLRVYQNLARALRTQIVNRGH